MPPLDFVKGGHEFFKGGQCPTLRGGCEVPWGPRKRGFDLRKVKIEVFAVSDRGECQLLDAFYWIKKHFS